MWESDMETEQISIKATVHHIWRWLLHKWPENRDQIERCTHDDNLHW